MFESETAKHEPGQKKPRTCHDHDTRVVVILLFVTAPLHGRFSVFRLAACVYICGLHNCAPEVTGAGDARPVLLLAALISRLRSYSCASSTKCQ